MGFNIKNNYGPNIEVNEGGNVTLYQDAKGMWHTVEDVEAEVVEEPTKVSTKTEVPQNDADLIGKLTPLFYNNEDDVRAFLKEISGMKDGDITDLVNKWVKNKRISDYGYSRKGVLWEILKEAGLYTKSRQNWCKRVN